MKILVIVGLVTFFGAGEASAQAIENRARSRPLPRRLLQPV